MQTLLEKGLTLISNAQTLKELREIARWNTVHSILTEDEKKQLHEALKDRFLEIAKEEDAE